MKIRNGDVKTEYDLPSETNVRNYHEQEDHGRKDNINTSSSYLGVVSKAYHNNEDDSSYAMLLMTGALQLLPKNSIVQILNPL